MGSDAPQTAPLRNASLSPARDPHGKIIGVELRCLYLHHEITLLPDALVEHAHAVIDAAAQRDATNGR